VAALMLVACSSGPTRRRAPTGGDTGEDTGGSGGTVSTGGGGGSAGRGGSGGSGGSGGGSGGGGGSAGGAGGSGGAGIELKIAWWGSMDRHTRTLDVIQAFQKKHPEVTFT